MLEAERSQLRAHQNDVCGLDEEGSEILSASLGDTAHDGSTTCAVLAWHETRPCSEIAPALECLAGTNGSDHGGRDRRANAGNASFSLIFSISLAIVSIRSSSEIKSSQGPAIRPRIRGDIPSSRFFRNGREGFAQSLQS
jgi:hypothetical protein